MKRGLIYIDIIKIIAMISVFTLHFYRACDSYQISYSIMLMPYMPFQLYLGRLGVSLFFISSGAALMYTYGGDFSIRNFYYKRIRGIYPMLWISYTFFLFVHAYIGDFLNQRIPIRLLFLSVLGVDGPFHELRRNWFLVGEWFLGVIIILYILFPLLRALLVRMQYPYILVFIFVLLGIVISIIWKTKYPIDYFFVVRVAEFAFGMALVHKPIKKMEAMALLSAAILGFSAAIDYLQQYPIIKTYIIGTSCFILLQFLFQNIENSYFEMIMKKTRKIFYPFFLLHHQILYLYLGRHTGHNYNGFESIVNYLNVFFICVAGAIVLDKCTIIMLNAFDKIVIVLKEKVNNEEEKEAVKDSERDFIKKIGILLLGVIIGVVIEKIYINTIPVDVSKVDTYQNKISLDYIEALPKLEEVDMISEQEYGNWIGRDGICIDTCNNRECSNEKLIINLNEPETTIIGWAADFNSVSPLKELYMEVGEKIIKCTYGEDRQSVVDHYQDENLRYVGINMTVPTEIFEEKNIQVAFIGVGQDGEHIYKPVIYDVEYVE